MLCRPTCQVATPSLTFGLLSDYCQPLLLNYGATGSLAAIQYGCLVCCLSNSYQITLLTTSIQTGYIRCMHKSYHDYADNKRNQLASSMKENVNLFQIPLQLILKLSSLFSGYALIKSLEFIFAHLLKCLYKLIR